MLPLRQPSSMLNANMVNSSERMLARQERASTTSITTVAIAKGAAEIAYIFAVWL